MIQEVYRETQEDIALIKGAEFEKEVFGYSCVKDARVPRSRISFEQAMKSFFAFPLAHKEWNPHKPHTPSAKLFHQKVEGFFRKFSGNQKARVAMLPTLGTALDHIYGIDGIFTVGNVYVTFDLTCMSFNRADEANKKSELVDYLVCRNYFNRNTWALCEVSRAIAYTLWQRNLLSITTSAHIC